jgi:thiamine biosynthesis lipoprotein
LGDARDRSADERVAVERRDGGLMAACFSAMACPCEILVPAADQAVPLQLGRLAAAEAWRIEQKFSRYRDDSVVARIHRSAGQPVELDPETASLVDFAARCFELSGGRFDITSGILRRAWKFDGSGRLPRQAAIDALLPLIGFAKLRWQAPHLTVPAGMELDFGGIGKEYAVDRVLAVVTGRFAGPVLVNFGGDLAANRAPPSGAWRVGVERPDSDREAALLLELQQGALATSGDTHRYLLRDGIRYSHIMDVTTGWPVVDAPRSVTVAGSTCVEAGMLATFAMLRGAAAESFLDDLQARYWCLR